MADTIDAACLVRRTRGARVIRFIEQHCVFTNGEWAGKPFRALPWQRRLLYELFEIEPDGLRRYRWCLLGVPKKNGKTELAAALALYFLLADGEPSPLVICAAASEEQADLVFGAARRMVELSPTLHELCECFEGEILVPSLPGAKLKRVAAASGTNDGLNIHVIITDELHEWAGPRGQAVWDVLTNGTGARRQPMVIQITTAGYDEETICYRQYAYGKRIESGEVEDRRYFFRWYEAPQGADHRDPAVWEAANPSYDVTVRSAFYADQLTKKTENTFRRYFLNQWTENAEAWLPPGAWDACMHRGLTLVVGAPLFIGIDAAQKHDATALVSAQWQAGDLAFHARIWEPPINPHNGKPVEGWTMPWAELEHDLRRLCDEHDVRAIGFDPRFLAWHMDDLLTEGFPLQEIPQTHARMVPASTQLYELITTKRLKHNGDPLFARHIKNAVAKQVAGMDGWRLSKGTSKKRMDGAIAAAMAASLAHQPQPEPKKRRVPSLHMKGG